jgi:hypothetical protein
LGYEGYVKCISGLLACKNSGVYKRLPRDDLIEENSKENGLAV